MTEVKPRLSGKHWTLERSPKINRCSNHLLRHIYSTTAGCETRKLTKSKKILMVLQEADVCQPPETPSFTSLMLLQCCEKLPKFANEFSNPE